MSDSGVAPIHSLISDLFNVMGAVTFTPLGWPAAECRAKVSPVQSAASVEALPLRHGSFWRSRRSAG
jgi:hypothetical protein